MKFKILALTLCLALVLALCGCSGGNDVVGVNSDTSSHTESEVSSKVETSSSEVSSSEVSSTRSETGTSSLSSNTDYTPIDDEEYLLMLTNPWVPLPEGFKPRTTPIPSGYGTWSNMHFATIGFNDLIQMMDDAKKDGIKLILVSSTRTMVEQQSLFNNKVDRVMKAHPEYTRKQAEIEAATAVAIPGTSEHQLGLAVDFNTTEDSFRYSDEFKWLQENCYDYGFIYRYPDNKQDTTGIIPEPWHYRYVGKENAKKIKESGKVFEEYLASLY
jgi:D-alanyl-D-alanine carboxypeptidase